MRYLALPCVTLHNQATLTTEEYKKLKQACADMNTFYYKTLREQGFTTEQYAMLAEMTGKCSRGKKV